MEKIVPIIIENSFLTIEENYNLSSFDWERTVLEGNTTKIIIDYYHKVFYLNYYGEDVFQGRLHRLSTAAIKQGVNWKHNIFRIENSCLIEKIHEDNMRYFEQLDIPMYHYFIKTKYNNDIIELVLTSAPDITIEKI